MIPLVMSQFENSQQRQNFGKIALTSLDSRGFEWNKRVSNLEGNDMESIININWNILYIYYISYTYATRFGIDGKKGKLLAII